MEKKLYKSQANKKICGVCGGLANYFGIDATWIRIGFALLGLAEGIGIAIYFIMSLVMDYDVEIETREAEY